MIALTAITNSSLKVMDTAITNSSQVAVVVVHHKVAVHHKAHTASKGSRFDAKYFHKISCTYLASKGSRFDAKYFHKISCTYLVD